MAEISHYSSKTRPRLYAFNLPRITFKILKKPVSLC